MTGQNRKRERDKDPKDREVLTRLRCRACGTMLNVNRSTRLCVDCAKIVDWKGQELMEKQVKSMKKRVVLF